MPAYLGAGVGRYHPNDAQRSLFEEWKLFCISYLISFKEGVNVRTVPGGLAEMVGEDLPLAKMGLPSINHFLYCMADCIEVRSVDGYKMFVYIREIAIPDNQRHIRDMVLVQQKDKSCKSKSGVIRRPTKNQSKYEPAESLLKNIVRAYTPSTQVPFRPILQPVTMNRTMNKNRGYSNSNARSGLNAKSNYQGTKSSPYQNNGRSQGGSAMSFANRPCSSTIQTNRSSFNSNSAIKAPMPVRPRYVDGLIDNFDDDEDDGFEYYSGANTFSDSKWNTVASPATEIAPKPVGASATAETKQKKPDITTYQPPAMRTESLKHSNDGAASTTKTNSSATAVTNTQTLPVSSQSLYLNIKKLEPALNALPSLMTFTSVPVKPVLQPVNMNRGYSNSNVRSLQPPAMPTELNKRSTYVAASTATNNNSSATTVTNEKTLPGSSQSLYSSIKKLDPALNSLPSLIPSMPVFLSTSVLPEVKPDDDDTENDEDEAVLAETVDLPKENLNKEEPRNRKGTIGAVVDVNLAEKLTSVHITDPGSNLNGHSVETKDKVNAETFKSKVVVRVIVEPLKTYAFPQFLRGGHNAKANLSLKSFLTMNGLCA